MKSDKQLLNTMTTSINPKVSWFVNRRTNPAEYKKLTIFDDGSAMIEDGCIIEIVFDDDPNAWKLAVDYLATRGFSEEPSGFFPNSGV